MTDNGTASPPGNSIEERPLVIGLTGGIGSGKSAVADCFSELGIPVIDTDIIARELVEPGQPALAEIITAFGTDCLTADGRLDRNYLRGQVFSDPGQRAKLEAILHPEIRRLTRERIEAVHAPYCITVIPLLLETRHTDLVDRVLVVDAEETSQLDRVMARDKLSKAAVTAIMQAQADRETRLAAADDIILNNSSLESLADKVQALHTRYMELSHGS